MIKKLKEIQNQFVEGVYDEKKLDILSKIKTDGIDKKQLLGIYRDGVYATLLNALKLTYPRIYDIIGEKKFNKIANDFIKENRSKSGNLDDYGAEFSEFLSSKKEEFLSQVANLEWFSHLSYLSKD